MNAMPLYQFIASKLIAMENCQRSENTDWADKHRAAIETAVEAAMPHGSGFDSGTDFDFISSTPERLVFATSFHHMDEHGGYSGRTHHQVIVTPSLAFRFTTRVTGRDHNEIKAYIADLFNHHLAEEYVETNQE